MRNKLLTGAGIKVLINGVDLGISTSVQYNESTAHEEDRGLDSLLPFELSLTNASINGVVSVLRLRDSGGMDEYGVGKQIADAINEEYFTIEVKDRHSGSTYFKIDHAVQDGSSWSVSAKGIMGGQFSFHGLSSKGNKG